MFQKLAFLKHKITRSDDKGKYKFSASSIYKSILLKKRIHQPTTTVTSSGFCVIAPAIIQKLYRELLETKFSDILLHNLVIPLGVSTSFSTVVLQFGIRF